MAPQADSLRCIDCSYRGSCPRRNARASGIVTSGRLTTTLSPSILASASTKCRSAPAYLEPLERPVLRHQAAAQMRELYAYRSALDGHRFIHRPRVLDVAVVHVGQRHSRQAVAQRFLVVWMHVLGVADVDGDGHTPRSAARAIGGLSFAHPRIVADVLQRRQLHDVKRKIAFAPELAPVFDQRLHHVRIERNALTCRRRWIRPGTRSRRGCA